MEEALPSSGPIQAAVYPSISYDEFGRLLRKFGFPAEPVAENDRFGYRTLAEPRFTAWMQTPFKGRPDEFAAVFLHGFLDLPPAVALASVQALNWKLMVAHVAASGFGRLAVAHTLIVYGGITELHLRDQLWHWSRDLHRVRDEVRKQARRAAGATLH
jgi:hypothetical protein